MDLSRIPEPLRGRLEEQLSRLPPEVRGTLEKKLANLPMDQLEAVLKRTAPMLEKLAGNKSVGKGSAGGASVSKPPPRRTGGTGAASATGSTTGQAPMVQSVFEEHNHYNNTIQRGDRGGPPLFVIMFLVACAVVFLQTLGVFD